MPGAVGSRGAWPAPRRCRGRASRGAPSACGRPTTSPRAVQRVADIVEPDLFAVGRVQERHAELALVRGFVLGCPWRSARPGSALPAGRPSASSPRPRRALRRLAEHVVGRTEGGLVLLDGNTVLRRRNGWQRGPRSRWPRSASDRCASWRVLRSLSCIVIRDLPSRELSRNRRTLRRGPCSRSSSRHELTVRWDRIASSNARNLSPISCCSVMGGRAQEARTVP